MQVHIGQTSQYKMLGGLRYCFYHIDNFLGAVTIYKRKLFKSIHTIFMYIHKYRLSPSSKIW